MVSIFFDIIFMLQHYVWFRHDPNRSRVVVHVPKVQDDIEASNPRDVSQQPSPFKVPADLNSNPEKANSPVSEKLDGKVEENDTPVAAKLDNGQDKTETEVPSSTK